MSIRRPGGSLNLLLGKAAAVVILGAVAGAVSLIMQQRHEDIRRQIEQEPVLEIPMPLEDGESAPEAAEGKAAPEGDPDDGTREA